MHSPPIDAAAAKLVIVQREGAGGAIHTMGTAADLLARGRLTATQRSAVIAAVEAIAYLRRRFGQSGIDDAGHGVRLLLDSSDADGRGPYAEPGKITAGSHNPIDVGSGGAGARRVLPRDVALHEMTHVIQFAVLGSDADRLHPALAEGFADALSMLATRDWSIGESYFRTGRGAPRETIRQVGPSRDGVNKRGEPLVTDYRQVARNPQTEEHAAGAVISRTFLELQRRLGWSRAEDLLWTVLHDASAWRGGGSWQQAADAINRAAQSLWPGDATAQAAVGASMRVTHLDEARSR